MQAHAHQGAVITSADGNKQGDIFTHIDLNR
jgi:hypothetical protein